MICPVHHIGGGDDIDFIQGAEIIVLHGSVAVIDVGIAGHIDIDSSVIRQREGIGSQLVIHQRVGVPRLLGRSIVCSIHRHHGQTAQQ
ncbi:hypothetical protein D3C76_1749480 [compost metagenome]